MLLECHTRTAYMEVPWKRNHPKYKWDIQNDDHVFYGFHKANDITGSIIYQQQFTASEDECNAEIHNMLCRMYKWLATLYSKAEPGKKYTATNGFSCYVRDELNVTVNLIYTQDADADRETCGICIYTFMGSTQAKIKSIREQFCPKVSKANEAFAKRMAMLLPWNVDVDAEKTIFYNPKRWDLFDRMRTGTYLKAVGGGMIWCDFVYKQMCCAREDDCDSCTKEFLKDVYNWLEEQNKLVVLSDKPLLCASADAGPTTGETNYIVTTGRYFFQQHEDDVCITGTVSYNLQEEEVNREFMENAVKDTVKGIRDSIICARTGTPRSQ